MTAENAAETATYGFDAEVRQLLDLVIHSLYSDREIFLRELISNASDALDRARLLGLSRDDLRAAEGPPSIHVSVNEDLGTITISDTGVGLTAEQAKEHLGTIARSGTKAFAQALEQKDSANALIGQFGVGFYAALMVAEKVEVKSLSAEPDAEAIVWTCDGSTEYTLSPGERDHRGTDVVLHLREDAKEFLDEARLRGIIRKHSEFVAWPIGLGDEDQVNEPKALWTRMPSEVEDEEYKDFYKHISGDWAEPSTWLHIRADAPLQYKAVLFIPSTRPFDLNHTDGKRVMKLYARRILIDPEARKLLPDYLRFVRGVVDSEDLQLNVSREMVQKTPVVEKISKALVSKVLRKLRDIKRKEPELWLDIWKDFGPTLKEGLHNDADNREKLLDLVRFNSTRHDDAEGSVSLAEYVEAMGEDQEDIWFLTGPDRATASRSPHLEAFRKKGWEVLLLTDPVDEWVVQSVSEYTIKGKGDAEDRVFPFKSVSRGELEVDEDEETPELDKDLEGWLTELFQGEVKGVRVSTRLTDSPSVLVDDDFGLGANMERILRSVQADMPSSLRFLEINPRHPMVKALGALHGAGRTGEAEPLARLLLDQARLVEGTVTDPAALVARLRTLGTLAAQALGVGDAVAESADEPAESAEPAAEGAEPAESAESAEQGSSETVPAEDVEVL